MTAKVGSGRQQLLSEVTNGPDETAKNFHRKLVTNFLREGIPLEKLEKGPFRDFLEEGFKTILPSVRSLRRIVVELADEVCFKQFRPLYELDLFTACNNMVSAKPGNMCFPQLPFMQKLDCMGLNH